MKKIFFLFVILFSFSFANAQFYDSGTVHFYIPAGGDPLNSSIECWIFDGNSAYWLSSIMNSWVRDRIQDGTILQEVKREGKRYAELLYSERFSTSSRVTYGYLYGNKRTGEYYSFKKDKSEIKGFFYHYDTGTVQTEYHGKPIIFVEISESELKPKAANLDFLYD